MMNRSAILMILALILTSPLVQANDQSQCASWMKHSLGKLHSSKSLDICELSANKAVLIVNTASHCGYTRQFSGLESLHQRYKDKGLVVIGFPSNSFNQEARSAEKTAEVCYKNYGVTFAMTDAVPVRGDQAHPIFQHLSQQTSAPNWNFNKYLISPDGSTIEHFGSNVEPESKRLTQAIERWL